MCDQAALVVFRAIRVRRMVKPTMPMPSISITQVDGSGTGVTGVGVGVGVMTGGVEVGVGTGVGSGVGLGCGVGVAVGVGVGVAVGTGVGVAVGTGVGVAVGAGVGVAVGIGVGVGVAPGAGTPEPPPTKPGGVGVKDANWKPLGVTPTGDSTPGSAASTGCRKSSGVAKKGSASGATGGRPSSTGAFSPGERRALRKARANGCGAI